MQTISVMLQADNPSHIEAFQAIVDRLRLKVHTHPVTIEPRLTIKEHLAVFRFVSWCSEEYTAETIDIVRAFVALAMVEWVIDVIEPELVASCVNKEVAEASDEWETVNPYVLRALHEPLDDDAPVGRAAIRKARLYRTFFSYLLENRELHLDGFVRFRLKEYRQEVEDVVLTAVEEYMEDKQYQEFLELLRYFISTQDTQYETIHIVPADKHFELYDEHGSLIPLEQLEVIFGIADSPERIDDTLISSLITLAPYKIVFHQTEIRPSLAKTIHSLFDGRVTYCSSCAHCLLNGSKLDLQHPTQL